MKIYLKEMIIMNDEIIHDEGDFMKLVMSEKNYISKQEILNKLEIIKDIMDTDFLNRYTIEGIIKDITELQLKINKGMR